MSRKNLGIGCLGLIVLFVVIVAVMPGGDEDTPEPTATTEQAINEVAPDEPEEEAATDVPEQPTEDATAAAVEEYLVWVAERLLPLAEAMTNLGTLSTNAGSNPALMLDGDWQLEVAVALGTYLAQAEMIRENHDYPQEVSDLHVLMLTLADQLDDVAHNYAQGLDEVDSSKIQASIEATNNVTVLIGEITVEIERLKTEYNIDM